MTIMQFIIIINGKLLELILYFKIPMGMRKGFFGDYKLGTRPPEGSPAMA
jgi:hypothetical protein